MGIANLSLRHEAVLRPMQPFHFLGTFHKPSHFPAPVDCFKGDQFWFTMLHNGLRLGVNLAPLTGRKDGVRMRLFSRRAISASEIAVVIAEVRQRFALDIDLTEFRSLARKDGLLAPVERRWRGMRPSCAFSLYELICITISLQNAQVSRSVKMLRSMLERFGSRVRFDGVELYCFWAPEVIAEAKESELRELKVGYRALSFMRVSQFFKDHLDFENAVRELPREQAAKRLREIYGVGPATAWYLLFESMKHCDAFDHVSPWEQKIISKLMFAKELVSADRILREARARWGQWRMLAVHYIFEDLFWRHAKNAIPWLNSLIRL